MGVGYFPAFAELCGLLHSLHLFPQTRESFRKANETGEELVTDPRRDLSHQPLPWSSWPRSASGLALISGPSYLCSLLVSVVFWNTGFECFESSIIGTVCSDGRSDYFLGLILDFWVISLHRCRCFGTEGSDALLFTYASNTWSATSYLSSQNI